MGRAELAVITERVKSWITQAIGGRAVQSLISRIENVCQQFTISEEDAPGVEQFLLRNLRVVPHLLWAWSELGKVFGEELKINLTYTDHGHGDETLAAGIVTNLSAEDFQAKIETFDRLRSESKWRSEGVVVFTAEFLE